jgi:hypothetical protein
MTKMTANQQKAEAKSKPCGDGSNATLKALFAGDEHNFKVQESPSIAGFSVLCECVMYVLI